MGWRGITLGNGLVWIDHAGAITAINHETDALLQRTSVVIAHDKSRIHPSLSQYEYPILWWETSTYSLRIDRLAGESLRLCLWKRGVRSDALPALVLTAGTQEFHGSGGNHAYEFSDGDKLYVIRMTPVGTSEVPPGELRIYSREEVSVSPEARNSYQGFQELLVEEFVAPVSWGE